MPEGTDNRAAGRYFLSATIFASNLHEIDLVLTRVLERIRQRMTRYEGALDLDSVFVTAPPAGGAHAYKLALYEPLVHPGSTVMVVNLADGWNSVVGLVAKEHLARQIQVTATIDGVEYPKFRFQTWRERKDERLVMTMRDASNWTFVQRGTPFPFERPDDLEARRAPDRMNRPLILSYLRNLGWDLENDDFWKSNRPAIYFEQGLIRH